MAPSPAHAFSSITRLAAFFSRELRYRAILHAALFPESPRRPTPPCADGAETTHPMEVPRLEDSPGNAKSRKKIDCEQNSVAKGHTTPHTGEPQKALGEQRIRTEEQPAHQFHLPSPTLRDFMPAGSDPAAAFPAERELCETDGESNFKGMSIRVEMRDKKRAGNHDNEDSWSVPFSEASPQDASSKHPINPDRFFHGRKDTPGNNTGAPQKHKISVNSPEASGSPEKILKEITKSIWADDPEKDQQERPKDVTKKMDNIHSGTGPTAKKVTCDLSGGTSKGITVNISPQLAAHTLLKQDRELQKQYRKTKQRSINRNHLQKSCSAPPSTPRISPLQFCESLPVETERPTGKKSPVGVSFPCSPGERNAIPDSTLKLHGLEDESFRDHLKEELTCILADEARRMGIDIEN